MCIQELSTCQQYKTPVKIVSLNNRYLGMVRQWQQIDYGGRYSHSYMDALPDFVKLAEAYGHVGMRIDKPSDVEPALREAIRAEGPHGVPRLPHRPDRERLADGARRARGGCTEMLLGLGGPRDGTSDAMKHIMRIVSLLENEPGALSRVVGAVLGARLQHRDADGRADRGRRRCRA